MIFSIVFALPNSSLLQIVFLLLFSLLMDSSVRLKLGWQLEKAVHQMAVFREEVAQTLQKHSVQNLL